MMRFCERDSGGDLIIASQHPNWSITWAWILSWRKRRGGRFIYWHRTYRYRRGLYGFAAIGRVRFERQPTMRVGEA